ncbi:Phosphorylated CTD-interacting factor 1 [Holothuria leucospilota]|uniref:Phosphorylated CTD-interacting factor 1 n=1 Tax=Holothuria leucospilota TaxID=206669 RepID=A0A9Q1HFW0_HOLLE|nr:Phosphorylated CTD-interacting factor 1 [Holothuria leucospilota]
MDDAQILPELPDELYQAGWRVHYSLSENRPYFFNEETKQSAWDLPLIQETVRLSAINAAAGASEVSDMEIAESPIAQKLVEVGRFFGKPNQQLMDEPMTRFPLGADENCSVTTNDVPPVVVQIMEFISATMMDKVTYGYLKQNCEGCDMGWSSQRDHRCLHFGSCMPVSDMYFNDMQHLVKDAWVVETARDYLLNVIDTPVLNAVMNNIRTSWKASPQKAVDALEKTDLDENIRHHLEEDFIPRRLGHVDYDSVELNYSL